MIRKSGIREDDMNKTKRVAAAKHRRRAKKLEEKQKADRKAKV